MLRKLSTFAVVSILICGLGSRSFAQSLNLSDTKLSEPPQIVQFESSENPRVRPNDKLKSDIGKLVSDTKAGKVKVANGAGQSAKKNGLSKGTKIAVVVGITAAVVILTVVYSRNHMFDGLRLPPQPR